MANLFYSLPGEMGIFSDAIHELNLIELRLKKWHRMLPDNLKEDYKGLYESFATHISEGRVDLAALFAEHLVHKTASLVAQEEEEQS